MRIRLRCLPGYEGHLPKPKLAAANLPGWLRAMPSEAPGALIAGGPVRTVKQCPPFLDALQTGILFPLAADLAFKNGEFSWSWDLPPHPESRASRSPIGIHVPEQATGYRGLARPGQIIVKFINFWTVELPPGWSMLFVHPINRLDLPFRTLSGLVDCDAWAAGFVHFPALWTDPGFDGVLEAGTPVAQGIPLRREALELDIAEMAPDALAAHIELQDKLHDDPGVYRKRYRGGRQN